ncbi:AAA family ATPase, partial [Streptomyces bambusae]
RGTGPDTAGTVDGRTGADGGTTAGFRAAPGGGSTLTGGSNDDSSGSALGAGAVVWDATSLTEQQRSLVRAVARRRNALVTHVVVLVDEDELVRRNQTRAHPVPPDVLGSQLRRFDPPYPGRGAHRTWYVGADGAVGDTAGTLAGGAEDEEA